MIQRRYRCPYVRAGIPKPVFQVMLRVPLFGQSVLAQVYESKDYAEVTAGNDGVGSYGTTIHSSGDPITVQFDRAFLGAGLVAHEMFHAAMAVCQDCTVAVTMADLGEVGATVCGVLVRAFWDSYLKEFPGGNGPVDPGPSGCSRKA